MDVTSHSLIVLLRVEMFQVLGGGGRVQAQNC
jgi:hypothetical protein